VRRVPLRRKTPLRAGGKLPAVGAARLRWAEWQHQERLAVMARARTHCESCGIVATLEWAHLFGRNNKGVGEPVASSRFMTAGLCRICHIRFDTDRDTELCDRLRWRAIRWLMAYLADQGYPVPVILSAGADPLGAARIIDREARSYFV